ncbi:MAG: hypothetical protein AAGA75_06275 [Cyanobacteria bacterium P01_E01_bin.6]
MRVSLVTLCSLTACAIQDYSTPLQAQALPEPEAPGVETATLPTSDVLPAETPSLSLPEHSEQPLFSLSPDLMAQVPESFDTDSLERDPIESDVIESDVIEIDVSDPITASASFCHHEHRSVTALGHTLSTSVASELASNIETTIETTENNADPHRLLDGCVPDGINTEESVTAIAQNVSPPQLFAQNVSPPQSFVESSTVESSTVESSTTLMASEGAIGDIIHDAAERTTNQLRTGTLDQSPLERPPTRLFNLETANQLPAGSVQLSAGFHSTLTDNTPGTGNQVYYGDVTWGIRDDLQLSFIGQAFDDPPQEAIDGSLANITLLSFASSVKYRLINEERFSLGVLGSVELLSLSSPLFDTDDSEEEVIGALQVPLTYAVSPELQFHLTPGVSFFPGEFSDSDFYGTTFTLGAGVSWQPSERWLLYSTLNIPIGPGGNAIDSDDANIERRLVWSVGTRYNVTPKVGVDLYATNGFGVTPATSILSFIPDGDDAILGIRLNYAPDGRSTYRSSFRQTPFVPLSDRDRQLLVDGFTVTTANTVQPGSVALSTGFGSNGNYSVSLAYSPDQDFQIEGMLEEFGSEDEVSDEDSAGDDLKYLLGARIRLLDQVQGDPFSLAARVLGGRDTDSDGQTGILFFDVPLTYQVNSRAALFLNPKVAAFSSEFRVGIGLGVNYEVIRGLQLIGEVTPVIDGENGEPTVWAAGARYQIPRTSVNLDLYATNAIGRNGLGTLAAEPGARFGFNVNWILGDR